MRTSNYLEATGGPVGGGKCEPCQARHLIRRALEPCHCFIGLQPYSRSTKARENEAEHHRMQSAPQEANAMLHQ
jgi:hypothetical protein